MSKVIESEVNSLFSAPAFDRRAFVVTSLGAGFALAVLPVSAQTITTPADGLVAGEVKIPVAGATWSPTARCPRPAAISR